MSGQNENDLDAEVVKIIETFGWDFEAALATISANPALFRALAEIGYMAAAVELRELERLDCDTAAEAFGPQSLH